MAKKEEKRQPAPPAPKLPPKPAETRTHETDEELRERYGTRDFWCSYCKAMRPAGHYPHYV